MDPDILAACTGATIQRATVWLQPILEAMAEFSINTSARQAAFLAQVGHESGGMKWSREIWGPTPAQLRYEGRADLGNTQPGDGSKYRGRGFIQITGRNNYTEAGKALHLDLVNHPEILEEPEMCALSAAWWWKSHGLNEMADDTSLASFTQITRRINGGLNGLKDRVALWLTAKRVLCVRETT